MASDGTDLRLRYSDQLEPVVYNGTKSLGIWRSLETSNPAMLSGILNFVQYYSLGVHGRAPQLAISRRISVGEDILAKTS